MLVLIGASASGKTEIAKCLIRNHNFKKMVTYTTRPPRVGETDGVDYHFLTEEAFLIKKNIDFFLETSRYSGYDYGTAFKDASVDKVLIVDMQGAHSLYEELKDDVMIFFVSTPESIRRQRMLERGDNESDIERRLAVDRVYFDHERLPHVDYVIENTDHDLEVLTAEINAYYKVAMIR